MPSLREFAQWFSAADVGRELGVSRQRVHVLLEEGRIGPAVHTRLGWLVEPGAVARAAEKRRAAAASRG